MTGPEHYREAEEALAILDLERDPEEWDQAIREGSLAVAIQAAQVHATLALAAAAALNGPHGLPGDNHRDWYETAARPRKNEAAA